MSYHKDREEFLALMEREGVPFDVARAVIRDAHTIQQTAERECDDEAFCNPDRPRFCTVCEQDRPSWFVTRSHGGTAYVYICRACHAERRIAKRLAPFTRWRVTRSGEMRRVKAGTGTHGDAHDWAWEDYLTGPRVLGVFATDTEALGFLHGITSSSWHHAQKHEGYKVEQVGIVPVFQGDPRGACVKLKVPSGRTDDWGQTGICVPTRVSA